MMKKEMKKLLFGMLLALTVAFSTGCSPEGPLMFEGDSQRVDVIEEKIEDRLEEENADIDLEVDILEEVED